MSIGFICYVSGRTDPTHFFYNLVVSFDAPPPLAKLKEAVEERVLQDDCVPDGSEYYVGDFEVLDFRIGMWVTLESKSQLYSGCQLNALRTVGSSSAAGVVDRAYRPNGERVLRFAVEAQTLFEALDTEDKGELRLPSFLKVFRANVDFAIEAFTQLDRKLEGCIRYRDFLLMTKEREMDDFFRELRLRIETQGKRIKYKSDKVEKKKKEVRLMHRQELKDSDTEDQSGSNPVKGSSYFNNNGSSAVLSKQASGQLFGRGGVSNDVAAPDSLGNTIASLQGYPPPPAGDQSVPNNSVDFNSKTPRSNSSFAAFQAQNQQDQPQSSIPFAGPYGQYLTTAMAMNTSLQQNSGGSAGVLSRSGTPKSNQGMPEPIGTSASGSPLSVNERAKVQSIIELLQGNAAKRKAADQIRQAKNAASGGGDDSGNAAINRLLLNKLKQRREQKKMESR